MESSVVCGDRAFPHRMKLMYEHVNEKNGQKSPLISDECHQIIVKNAERLDSVVIYDRDFDYDYFGFKVGLPRLLYYLF